MTTLVNTAAVLQERRGPALWLRLNRPESLNGLNPEVIAGLTAGLDAAEADPEIRVVVLAGEGRAFCAGADLIYVESLADAPVPDGASSARNDFLQRLRVVLDRIEAFRKPVIAAVNGITVGGGLELVLVADFAIAARSAKVGDGHSVYAQLPGGGATVRLVRRVGLAFAKYLMYSGNLHLPERYEGTGLFIDVVDDDELEAAVDKVAATIGERSPLTSAAMKRLANAAHETPQAVALSRELELHAVHEHTADWLEGITAFSQKRTPSYKGR